MRKLINASNASIHALAVTSLTACGVAPDDLDPVVESNIGREESAIINAAAVGAGGEAVRVLASDGHTCSGTLVRNDVVLTAWHCVDRAPGTTYVVQGFGANGILAGPTRNVTQFTTWRCDQPPGQQLCWGGRSGKIDATLLRLDEALPIDGDTVSGFRAQAFLDGPEMLAANLPMLCQGRGNTACGSGLGINRWAFFQVNNATQNRIHWTGLAPVDAWMTDGDSGGGCFIDGAAPIQVNMFVVSACPPGPTSNMHGEVPEIYRPLVRAQLGAWATPFTRSFSSTSHLADFDFPSQSQGGAQSWSVSGGALVEPNNIYGGGSSDPLSGVHALAEGQIIADGCVQTKITSSDDDHGGLIFRYFDEDNFYRLVATDSSNLVRLQRVEQGNVTDLRQSVVSFSWSQGVTLQLCGTKDFLLYVVNGQVAASALDTTFPEGRVGLYKRKLQDAHFDFFNVFHDSTVHP